VKGKRRIVFLFCVATSSLLFAGNLFNPNLSFLQIIALQWFGICGTILVYYYDVYLADFFKQSFSMNDFLENKIRTFFILQFAILAVPVVLFVLPPISLMVFLLMFFFGIIYSFNISYAGKTLQLRDIFIFKNIVIGFNWGALVLAGAGLVNDRFLLAVFLFTSLQIVIGSVVRDVFDIDKDRLTNMKTLPVVLNVANTLNLMHVANVFTLLVAFTIDLNVRFLIFALPIILWKALIIYNTQQNNKSALWCQTLNILLCFGIFFTLLIQSNYDFN